ncbi:nuclear nucleic acid-binding protein C1D [Drosophila hydei]|uniref:Nuclear nucleic acid-binding protein C1D n=1 Tax=Drosophila hydei TaxID=7224 RepID=A0A6J1LTS7_DROHY|nr:nuclear nucleic acid-binding protein C1D [Drosophila hydei]XP_023169801.1 nuclear nucleic acid-binding protein C1D [Drosophila hydei]
MDMVNNSNCANKRDVYFGQLNNDQLLAIIKHFSTSLDELENDLTDAIKLHDIQTLTTEERIKLDTFLTYINSTLFWMYLKLQGTDIRKHYILHDLDRAKELLAREQQITYYLSAHRLDLAATKRFIAAGMHTRFLDMDGVMMPELQYKCSLAESVCDNITNIKTTK